MKNTYRTEQRKIITEFLISNQNRFVNAEDILEYLKESNQDVGLTTIYRYLNLLEKENKVRVDTKNHTKYYQYIGEESNSNLFLKCRSCGKSMNLDCEEFEHINKHIKEEHKFNLDLNSIIYGTCEMCKEDIK